MKALRDWDKNDASQFLQKEVIDISKAGEGNMNCTMRVTLENTVSLVLKQSSHFCEKFPSIKAPIERIEFENKFYQLAKSNHKLSSFIPEIISFIEKSHLLVMQDLGKGTDFSYLYESQEELGLKQLESFSEILSELHKVEVKNIELENNEMKALNHAHMYIIPFQKNNGLNLDDICQGLEGLKEKFVTEDLVRSAEKLGKRYLKKEGSTLLHGDYYFGSLMETNKGVFMIDPEFCFLGDREFDIGVMFAHFILSDQPESLQDKFLDFYQGSFEQDLMRLYAGVEILRRILGFAQLPISKNLDFLESKLVLAKGFIID